MEAHSASWVLVGAVQPHKITVVSPAWAEIFGHAEGDVLGRTLRLFSGPLTNINALNQAVADAARGGDVVTVVVLLYNKQGEGVLVRLEIVPASDDDGGAAQQCLVKMEHCDFVPLKIAVAEDARAKVTLLATSPYSITNVSSQFAALYGMEDKHLLGRTLRLIFSPRTNGQRWSEMLQGAARGKRQDGSLWTCTPDMRQLLVCISVFPVLDVDAITHFMVVFSGGLETSTVAGINKQWKAEKHSP
eukprot:CAMPEP_0206215012 /NCGR_PEP_ID=MMETSP0047_2-20121206/1969_1 /ASSEMBLY_ACC=CAM_ASM_000192 /TAXON_ID=195065 /ORGANISM="Chroomonas mesostigmatica_cf, Strain CCMP1168" /LENGTH=245 /DNA_ID=CAMNT_0053637281 /DNA_START=92 /DNA_END=825 /DNA_ORIENTATION=+